MAKRSWWGLWQHRDTWSSKSQAQENAQPGVFTRKYGARFVNRFMHAKERRYFNRAERIRPRAAKVRKFDRKKAARYYERADEYESNELQTEGDSCLLNRLKATRIWSWSVMFSGHKFCIASARCIGVLSCPTRVRCISNDYWRWPWNISKPLRSLASPKGWYVK